MENLYLISQHKRVILIREVSILYILAAGAYCIFGMDNGEEHMVSKNLKSCFSKIINKDIFVRAHRSCYLNRNHNVTIERISPSKMCVVMPTGVRLPVNEDFIKKIRQTKKKH